MSAIDAIRAREAAKRPLPEPVEKETHGRKAVKGDASRPAVGPEPEPTGPEAAEEVDAGDDDAQGWS